ncbi:uncharacterized protein LOC110626719 isoform X2 [Manihot esculenta]|uniref:RING-type domain-containing protein n=2 Tax=Manihot esculenta TaxID=3983 RepID=A0A2C9V0K7_MANES|nr:uncharacterized protein LOC110626719 isoform X2 [Manihot esculenta]
MRSERQKQGDKSPMSASFPQSKKQIGPFELQDEVDDLADIFDNMARQTTSFPTRNVHGMPQSYAQEMAFPVIKGDISQCNVSHNPETGLGYLYEPVSGFPDLVGNVNKFCEYHALGDPIDASNIHASDLDIFQVERNKLTPGIDVGGGLQMSIASREANDSGTYRPWQTESKITHADTTPVSGHNPSSGEFGMNISQMCRSGGEANGNNIHIPRVFGKQLIHAGSTPVLGYNPRINGELRMNNSLMAGVARSSHPEMFDGNFLNLGYGSNLGTKAKYKVSSKDNNQSTKGIALPMLNTYSGQNVARSYLNSSADVAGFSSFQKYNSGCTMLALNESYSKSIGHAQHAHLVSGSGQDADGLSHQVWHVDEFSSLVQNVPGFSHQAQYIDRSYGLIQNVGRLSKPSRDGSVGNLLPLVDRQLYNHIPSSWNVGLGKRKERFANISPHTSFEGLPTELSIPNYSNQVSLPDAAWFGVNELSPPLSLRRSAIQPSSDTLQSSRVGAVRNLSPEPSMVLPFTGVTRSIGWQDQSGNLGQSQASVPIKLFGSLAALAHSNGEEIPAVNRPTQSSSVPSGPSLDRDAPMCPSEAPKPRCKKARSIKPASHLSAPTLVRTGPPHAPVASVGSLSPPIAQSVPSRPPLACTSSRLPSFPGASSPHYIKWQGGKGEYTTPRPSGNQCHICKRDLSFNPEGPIYQPEKPITAAVLPCGHHFHDSCLQRITPQNQAQDPPCIPCAMADNN